MRRAALIATWLAATLMAVVAAWGGVQLVARQVVAPLPASMAEASGTLEPVAPPPETAEPAPSPTAEPTAEPGTPAPQAPAATPSPAAPATPAEPNPTPRETRTYELVGGTVSIEYAPDGIRVIQATPKSGFTRKVEPESRGIKVEFESDDHRSRIDAWWDGGPQRAVREDERD